MANKEKENLKFQLKDFAKLGNLIRDDERYKIYDLSLEGLVISETVLHKGKETKGHSHKEADEVYFFMKGEGKIQLDEDFYEVKKKDIVLIPRGMFHKVYNLGRKDLVFICIFERYEGR